MSYHRVKARLLRHLQFPLLGCLLSFSVAAARTPHTFEGHLLQLNRPLAGTLKGAESHAYMLRLEAGAFARVLVTQRGVDVYVRALDAQKRGLAQANDSFGRTGPQLLEFVAEAGGDYLIEVTAMKDEAGGGYEIEFLGARKATDEDRARAAANGRVSAGNGLRSKATAEANAEALVEYEKALAIYRRLGDRVGQATSLQYTGRIHEARSDYKKALEYYKSALALWREAGERRGEAYAVNGIGLMHYYLGDMEQALAHYRLAGEIYREVGNREGEGLVYNNVANVFGKRGDVDAALESFEKALAVFREVGAKARTGYLLNNMAAAYRDMGDLRRAADHQNEALEIWRGLAHRHGTASALTNLASIHAQLGDVRKALSFYGQALPLCVDGGERNCEARAYWQSAALYADLGETQTALDHYAKSEAIYRQTGRSDELAKVLNSSGALYSSLGERGRAVALHTEALALSRKAQTKQDEAEALSLLADVYGNRGDARKARELYLQSLAISREIKNRLGEASNLKRLGKLAQEAGNNQEAIRLFEQALAADEEIGYRYGGALALHNLGVVYDASGDAPRALDYFGKALAVLREIENRSSEALLLYRVASAQKRLGRIAEARASVAAALEIVETLRGKIAAADLRSSYFATVQEYYDLYIELLMLEDGVRPDDDLKFRALQASEQARARGLLDLLQEAKADVRQGVAADLLAREKELLELINAKAARLSQAFGNPGGAVLAKALGEEADRLSQEYEALQVRIRQSSPRYSTLAKSRPLTLAEIQSLLGRETLLLEYKLGPAGSYLWVVSPDRLEAFELPPRAEIEALAGEAYRLIVERNQRRPGETAAQSRARVEKADVQLRGALARLGQTLLGPAAAGLGDKRLVVVADGALQLIPFGALPAPGSDRPLVTANEVVNLPSISVLAELRREARPPASSGKSVVVFADPVFEKDDPRLRGSAQKRGGGPPTQASREFGTGQDAGGLARLMASREEAKVIADLAPPGTSYVALDFEASRERAASAETGRYRVVHFATHGLLNAARPELSGLVLSLYDERGRERDGFLRLNQIYNLRLSSDLVVLSACRTALGRDVRGEGLVGLTRGFMYAGAPRVVASLWKVDDEATAELMKLFYRNLLQRRLTAARALRSAQAELQQQTRWRAPYYWAAFALQGDWR